MNEKNIRLVTAESFRGNREAFILLKTALRTLPNLMRLPFVAGIRLCLQRKARWQSTQALFAASLFEKIFL